MTPGPEKAAPIPPDVLALAEASLPSWYHAGYHVTHAAWVDCIARAILADREARPSLPDSEERIREDERDRLLDLFRNDRHVNAYSVGLLAVEGAMFPTERVRLRGGAS